MGHRNFHHGKYMNCKYEWVHFQGSNLIIFIVVSHINWGHLIKGRICSHQSQFFPLGEDPFWEDCLGKTDLQVSKNEVTKIVSL